MRLSYSMLFLTIGMAAVMLFHAQTYFPIWLSVVLLSLCSVYLLQQYRQNRLGLLVLVIWLIYALPFIHILPYIWFDFGTEPLVLWGLTVNPYMIDKPVIVLTGMLGAVGGLGIALGVSLAKPLRKPKESSRSSASTVFNHTLSIPIWLMWVGIGFALTVLSAPQETIFTAAYTESVSALDGANFGSAWMMSYVILTFTFIDTLFERKHFAKKLKAGVIGVVLLLVVVWYQLLRGDRESVPWVFGLALAYYYWTAEVTQPPGRNIPWKKLSFFVFLLIIITMVVGAIRSSFSGASLSEAIVLVGEIHESGSIGLTNILHGTWSATLLTPLSVAGDHIYGLLDIHWGRTYLDFLLSTIPGFLADAIGYLRPIDGLQGPAWEMRYGIGGTHAIVVPFMNFRMLGVFFVPAIWAFLLAYLERRAMRSINIFDVSFLVTLVAVAPHWLWYGEKNLITAVIIWLILKILYRVSLDLSRSNLLMNATCSGDR